ncbi:hypothetical protein ISS07_05160 [Candidatus Woesearchaeota archaeon]|nr:hypothetical protein [Candidatus Woesearchaeota archaeon]
MAFGATATLHAPSLMGIPYGMYLLVIVLIHMNFPFLFFVGGYVSHTALPALQSSLVSVAGPLTNLLLWLLALSVIKYGWVDRKHYNKVVMMGKLNLFFFAFNMIPLPGFDGSNFLMALIRAFF